MHSTVIIVDLEATCEPSPQDRTLMETIEIGAVRVEPGAWASVDEFQTFVRPTLRPQLSTFCTELTSITQAEVDGAPYFAQAFAEFMAWVGPNPCVLGTWGRYDVSQFALDCERSALVWPPEPFVGYWNIKASFAKAFQPRRRGLGAAMRRLGVPFEGRAHRGIDDVRAIATAVLPRLMACDPAAIALRDLRVGAASAAPVQDEVRRAPD